MTDYWVEELRTRMREFGQAASSSGRAVSIKLRIKDHCFQCEYPEAYKTINQYLRSNPADDCRFVEHESGPELLVWLALGTAGITLAKSVVDLVATIIKAHAEGIRRGDRSAAPIELIVRDVGPDGKVREERILRFTPGDQIDAKQVEKAMSRALKQLPPAPITKPVAKPRRAMGVRKKGR